METVAVYAEHPIKTYGIKAEADYVLLQASCPEINLAKNLERSLEAGELAHAVFSTSSRMDGIWLLCALLKAEGAAMAVSRLQEAGMSVLPPKAASLIHLQGPHFGDRYGLLAAVYKGLQAVWITPLVLQACMHSIFVVLDPDDAHDALLGLKEQFCAPE